MAKFLLRIMRPGGFSQSKPDEVLDHIRYLVNDLEFMQSLGKTGTLLN